MSRISVSARHGCFGRNAWAFRRYAQALRPTMNTVPHRAARHMRVLPYRDPGSLGLDAWLLAHRVVWPALVAAALAERLLQRVPG